MREHIVGKEINLNNFKGFLFASDNSAIFSEP